MRVALYLRVATAEQLDTTGRMVEECKKQIESHGWTLSATYVDVGSAVDQDRPQLNRMLADCGKGIFEMVYVRSMSQIARHTAYLTEVCDKMKENGVSIYSENEQIDTSTSTFGAVAAMHKAFTTSIAEATAAAEMELEETMEALDDMLGYMDELNHGLGDDVDRRYLKGIEIRVADKTIKLPLTDVTFTAIYDALGIIQEEM